MTIIGACLIANATVATRCFPSIGSARIEVRSPDMSEHASHALRSSLASGGRPIQSEIEKRPANGGLTITNGPSRYSVSGTKGILRQYGPKPARHIETSHASGTTGLETLATRTCTESRSKMLIECSRSRQGAALSAGAIKRSSNSAWGSTIAIRRGMFGDSCVAAVMPISAGTKGTERSSMSTSDRSFLSIIGADKGVTGVGG